MGQNFASNDHAEKPMDITFTCRNTNGNAQKQSSEIQDLQKYRSISHIALNNESSYSSLRSCEFTHSLFDQRVAS
ncbi:hypothetical protein VCR1J2_610002 [Vibrio coralliirubri]|nr:hypothetical protein VCR1J2_610002 [Vibrio coralliirubri]CDT79197.1 hypothetical protein VCR29J2_620001 [Vibrio coralliirubri]